MKNKIVRLIGGSVLAAVAVTGCAGMRSQGSNAEPFDAWFYDG